ncbi:hypothetical protein J3R30DRAFT_3408626 [Lentinula aciculospora]|uniref:Uncharacterized protein n=1 Tax=Lentinula aciculospora TaxID=153920 RepID=A0A9W8ZYT6_9AGAR|nr:hypothetical protein J3R30DRAFT_3408626 [Lentinula aciculospora]
MPLLYALSLLSIVLATLASPLTFLNIHNTRTLVSRPQNYSLIDVPIILHRIHEDTGKALPTKDWAISVGPTYFQAVQSAAKPPTFKSSRKQNDGYLKDGCPLGFVTFPAHYFETSAFKDFLSSEFHSNWDYLKSFLDHLLNLATKSPTLVTMKLYFRKYHEFFPGTKEGKEALDQAEHASAELDALVEHNCEGSEEGTFFGSLKVQMGIDACHTVA